MTTITLDIGRMSIPIHLLVDEAPTTCESISASLLLAGDALHDIWSGRVIFLPLDPAVHIPVENPTMYLIPGDVFFYERPEHLERGRPYGYLSLAEVGIVYGRDSQPAGPSGPKVVNLFGRIEGDALDALANVGDQMIQTGKQRVAVHS